MSAAEQREAIELRSFAHAYESALTQAMLLGKFKINSNMTQDMHDIIYNNPNPLIKVDLLMDRLKNSDLGKHVETMAILANDHGSSESEQNRKMKHFKALMKMAASQAAHVGQQREIAHQFLPSGQTAAEREHKSGTTSVYGYPPQPPLANPFSFQLPNKKKGGKKSHRKKSGKKSHKKRSHMKRSHMKSRRH
jgi:hypothetical protein